MMTRLPTIAESARQLRAGEVTALRLVEDCLARVDAREAQIRAWVILDAEGALRAARAADAELAEGLDRGPLHGIPLGIKDIVDVAGWPTRCGSAMLADAPAAGADATIVRRLRAAGAIFLGKTVTTEFASFDPPPTRNPWNLERTPGGSSSGSAAATAAGMCLGAIGSQTGGSICRPASFCGVAGLKPSYGRVSLCGLFPLAHHMDHPGPIARSAEDLALIFDVIAGHDPADVWSADSLFAETPARGCVAAIRTERSHNIPPRLGLIEDFFLDEASDSVRSATRAALDALAAEGAEMVVVPTGDDFWRRAVQLHRRVMAVEAALAHRPNFPARRAEYSPKIASLLDEGLAVTALDYAEALAYQPLFRRRIVELMGEFDALVAPVVSTTAPPADSTGDPRFQAVWSYSGLPVASIPCGVADDGLPVALQFAGPMFDEPRLLATADWAERAWKECSE